MTLSLGSVNLTSLANFPQLPKLQSLLLSDNRIAGGLEALTAAKLDQLTELDLSNNKFASLPSFKPLAGLRSLQALHVQANPAENSVKGFRQALFTMIAALQYVDDTDRFGKGSCCCFPRRCTVLMCPDMHAHGRDSCCAVERPALEEEDDDGDEYEDEEVGIMLCARSQTQAPVCISPAVVLQDDDADEPGDEDSEEANDGAESFEEQGEVRPCASWLNKVLLNKCLHLEANMLP